MQRVWRKSNGEKRMAQSVRTTKQGAGRIAQSVERKRIGI